jgi:hypothetical protein
MGVTTDEPGVVVELGVAGSADRPPVCVERVDRQAGGDTGRRPGGHEPAVERDPGQDVEMDAAFEPQAADDVEAVELDQPPAEVGQVPAGRRRRPADAPRGIERTAPLEDPGDRPKRRDRLGGIDPLLELMPDRGRAVLAEDALSAEPPPDVEDPVLDVDPGPADPEGDRWQV